MKTVALLTLALVASAAFYYVNQYSTEVSSSDDSEIFKAYTQWKSQFGMRFASKESDYRFQIFKNNYNFVNQFNAEQTGSLRLGMNIFAALTNEEYREKFVNGIPKGGENMQENDPAPFTPVGDFPASVDWVSKGAVAPVENQGQCGSCWAFSTKEALEGIYQIKTGNLQVLSAQQLVDCNNTNEGCNGGWPIDALKYTSQKGIESDSAYPYTSGKTGRASPCAYNKDNVVFYNTASNFVTPNNNQAAIQTAIQTQPLSILISASSIVFQLYTGGVLNSKICGTAEDHAVLLTGYADNAWTIKNSWGTGWGSKGYVYVAMTGDGPGICGVQQYVTYPSY